MSTTTLPTPSDLTITPRDRKFERGELDPRLWHGGNVEATAIYNALSTTFPTGEAFFVESVRAFREGAPPKLAAEIKGFTTQEAIHSREHAAFNRRAADSGYDLSKLEAQIDHRLAITKTKPPIVSLAATMALEHFTAILAHELLDDPSHLAGADKDAADLWRWHACEEIEHKGVAYDTWLHATRHGRAQDALEGEGEGDAVRHPQLRRRPHRRRAGVDAPGRRHRPSRLVAAALVSVDPPRHVPEDRRRLVQVLPAETFTRGTRTTVTCFAPMRRVLLRKPVRNR